jgi:alkanesulfonate monooxygenase
MTLRFHWRLPHGGETLKTTMASQADLREIGSPDLEPQIRFSHHAEQCGIDSLLTDFGYAKPDPMLLAVVLGMATTKIKFMIAYRSGLLAPTTFVQQLNTLSALINGRFSLNIVAGYSPQEQRSYGDFLSHDERYERTDEFLSICRSFWQEREVNFQGKYYQIENGQLSTPFVSCDRAFPELFIAGGSLPAQRLAVRQGTCWMRLANTPESLRADALSVRRKGIEVGIRVSVITRRTREEARDAARSLIADLDTEHLAKGFVRSTDSHSISAAYELAESEWLTPYFWTGAVRYIGPTAVALVGAPDDIANALMEYRSVGVSQFILSGWPKLEEMIRFGREVLPLVREKEASAKKKDQVRGALQN